MVCECAIVIQLFVVLDEALLRNWNFLSIFYFDFEEEDLVVGVYVLLYSFTLSVFDENVYFVWSLLQQMDLVTVHDRVVGES